MVTSTEVSFFMNYTDVWKFISQAVSKNCMHPCRNQFKYNPIIHIKIICDTYEAKWCGSTQTESDMPWIAA